MILHRIRCAGCGATWIEETGECTCTCTEPATATAGYERWIVTEYFVMDRRPAPGLHGCPLCDQPPPHGHQLPVILNARYYCPDGTRHEWMQRKWWQRRARCGRCGTVRKGR